MFGHCMVAAWAQQCLARLQGARWGPSHRHDKDGAWATVLAVGEATALRVRREVITTVIASSE
jgi:hypothetical protein